MNEREKAASPSAQQAEAVRLQRLRLNCHLLTACQCRGDRDGGAEHGRLDVVQGLDGVPGYDELRSRAKQTEILGVTVAICALEDLKAMKRAAGRMRDLADLEDLEATS